MDRATRRISVSCKRSICLLKEGQVWGGRWSIGTRARRSPTCALTVASATPGMGRIRTGVRLRRLCGGRAGGTNDQGQTEARFADPVHVLASPCCGLSARSGTGLIVSPSAGIEAVGLEITHRPRASGSDTRRSAPRSGKWHELHGDDANCTAPREARGEPGTGERCHSEPGARLRADEESSASR